MQEIRYLRHHEINKEKWDECIINAPNGLIYALSWYLDIVAPKWDAIVIDNYESVMPLNWRKKYLIKYLFQHDLTQQLGIFGKVNDNVVEKVILYVAQKYPYIDIKLNYLNKIPHKFDSKLQKRTNLIIDLDENEPQIIRKSYSHNAIKNIRKATKNNTFIWSDDPQSFIDFVEDVNPKYTSNDLKKAYKEIIYSCKSNDALRIVLSKNKGGKTVAGVFMTLFKNRLTFLFSVSSEEGKSTSATFGIIDYIISNANKDYKILDFEGSDIESIKYFYKGFGAKEESYSRFKMNNLIWIARIFKQ